MQVSVIAPGARPDAALRSAVERLLVELNPKAPPAAQNLERLLADPAARLLVAAEVVEPGGWPADPEDCAGMLTLTVRNSATRRTAHLDHVVVGSGHRRRGVARLLVEEALRLAAALGAQRVDLTSAPEREAAQELYRSLGFKPRRTNNWRRAL